MQSADQKCEFANPGDLREAIRAGRWTGETLDQCPGFVQCNLVILPREDAFDFLVYAQRNPKACPVIEVLEPGNPVTQTSAADADIRTDLGRYAVCRKGKVSEVPHIRDLWQTHSVGFLIGSSVSFDHMMQAAGIPASQVWVLDTKIQTRPAGRFRGPLVVTMRWMNPEHVALATQISARFPMLHGAPIHIGDPSEIGANLAEPLYGPPVAQVPAGVTPVFWACGVTPKRAALTSGIEQMITHVSGYAFVTDLPVERLGQD